MKKAKRKFKDHIEYMGVVYRDSHSLVYGWKKRKYSFVNWDSVWERIERKKKRKEKNERKVRTHKN